MNKRITYLLGAGASAQALPLIKKIKNGKPGLPEELGNYVRLAEPKITKNYSDRSDYDLLSEIVRQSIIFGTPDLYAKFLIETGDERNYHTLKRLLSNYFSLVQDTHSYDGTVQHMGKFDLRALTFLTTITQNKALPDNVRIISWNYDRQIEIAAEKLKPANNASKRIQNFSAWPNTIDGHSIVENAAPFLLHLNGVAGYDYSERNLCDRRGQNFDFSDISKKSLLSFAWEDESNFGNSTFLNNRTSIASKMVIGTQILVVIGYSFPFFNRKIDDSVMKDMKPTLKKIYFQDPFLNGSQLFSQFSLDPNMVDVVHVNYVDNYYVPFEL